MAFYRSELDKCSISHVTVCATQKKIIFNYMDRFKEKNNRCIAFKHAIAKIVSEYGELIEKETKSLDK